MVARPQTWPFQTLGPTVEAIEAIKQLSAGQVQPSPCRSLGYLDSPSAGRR